MKRRSVFVLLPVLASCAAQMQRDMPSQTTSRATPASVSTQRAPTRIYVSPVRVLSESGPERPQFNAPLLRLLRLRGYQVLDQSAGATSQATVGVDESAYRLAVVLRESTLTPPGLASRASSLMKFSAVLTTPSKESIPLGPFESFTEFSREEFPGIDVTQAGVNRAMTEALIPLVNAIDRLTP